MRTVNKFGNLNGQYAKIPNTKKVKCGKCERETEWNKIGMVSPIDKDGHNLLQVFLCPKCLEEWGKYYVKVTRKANNFVKPFNEKEFHKEWSKAWTKFLRGQYDKIEVEFT